MKPLFRILRPYWKQGAAGVIALIAVNIVQLFVPQAVRRALDQVAGGDAHVPSQALTTVIILAVIITGFRYLWRVFLFGMARTIKCALRKDLARRLLASQEREIVSRPTGAFVTLFSSDIELASIACGTGLLFFSDSFFLCLLSLFAMMAIDVRLTLFSCVPLLILPVMVVRFGREMHARTGDQQRQYELLQERTRLAFASVRSIKGASLEALVVERFQLESSHYARLSRAAGSVSARIDPTLGLVASTAGVLGLLGGGFLMVKGQLSVGSYVAFSAYLALLAWPLSAFGYLISMVQRGNVAAERLESCLAGSSTVDSRSDQFSPRPQIRLQQVSYRYHGAASDALSHVSIEVSHPSFIGVVGLNGSGKSTLIKIIAGVLLPTNGSVEISGKDVQAIGQESYRREVAVIPQEPFIFSMSIAENISLGLSDVRASDLRRVAELACLAEEIEQMRAGFDTLVGERGVTLSGGQRQRLALARLLLRTPKIVLLDDALSAVDLRTEDRLWENLAPWLASRTVVVVSNRIRSVQKADEILVLAHGEIIQRGNYLALVGQPGLFRTIAEYQSHGGT